MTPARFTQIGICLFGVAWRSPMAEALEVNTKSVWRWQHDTAPIPDGVALDLADICQERIAEITELRQALMSERPAEAVEVSA